MPRPGRRRSSRPSSSAARWRRCRWRATLTQVLAEVMAGVAYAQLVNPGCPVIFGAFVTSIDMNSGAPTFGTPEASKILWGAGQLARRLNLPFRSGGALCGSKLPDAQAAYESANTLQAALLGGRQLHAARLRLAGGRAGVVLREVRARRRPARRAAFAGRGHRPERERPGDGRDRARSGRAGISSAAPHTQANFKTAFWRTEVLDYRPFETWAEAGERDSMAARERADAADAGGVRSAGARSRRGRGAARLRGAAQGVGAGRVRVGLTGVSRSIAD